MLVEILIVADNKCSKNKKISYLFDLSLQNLPMTEIQPLKNCVLRVFYKHINGILSLSVGRATYILILTMFKSSSVKTT